MQWSISTALSLPQGLLVASKNKQINEYIQQIDVVNAGNAEAKDIVIKFPGTLTQYVITKHTNDDHVKEYKTATNIEIVYDDLPPSGGYHITVMASSSPLSAEQIVVSHKSGIARYISPSSSNSLLNIGSILPVFISIIYLLFFIQSMRDYLKYRLIFHKFSKNIREIVAMKKPWYLPDKDWPELQLNLINNRVEMTLGTYYPLSQSEAFALLNCQRPSAISEGDWDHVVDKAANLFVGHAVNKALDANSKAEIMDLLTFSMPSGMSEANKEKYQRKLSACYVDVALANATTEELVSTLMDDNKPIALHSQLWERFKLKAANKVADSLRENIVTAKGLSSLESEMALKVVSYSDRRALLELNDGMLAAAKIKTERETLNKEREQLADNSFNVNMRENAVRMEEEKIKEQRSKVWKQLEVIDRAVKDPEYLSRIEPDNDLFVPGNWALLRELKGAGASSASTKS